MVLIERTYRPIVPDARGRLLSRELGLELAVVDSHLCFFVPSATEPLPTRTERAERERERAERERGPADRAEEELRQLRTRLDDPRDE